MRLALIGGAWAGRSPIGNNIRSINLFPEKNRPDGPATMTLYQRPGNRRVVVNPGAKAPVRGIYRASNGVGYCVIGQNVYSIGPTWALTLLGVLSTVATNLVSFTDNGTTIVLGDGSPVGYEILMANNSMTTIVDPTGTFTGTIKFDNLDGYVVWVIPATQDFGSTYDNEIVFDGTYFAAKNGYPDLLVSLYVNRHELILFGSLKSEIWYDAGNPLFPFALLPGAYIEHGLLAPYSLASIDTSVFWLGQDLNGIGFVFQQTGYTTKKISNYAISYAINQMKRAGANLSDAIGYCYTLEGHAFYVLTFVSGDQTWVFDLTLEDPELAWHQRGWTDVNGIIHRERANCYGFINGEPVVGDWENGDLLILDNDFYFDDVAGTSGPVSYIRTLPLAQAGMNEQEQLALADGKTLRVNRFTVDLEPGNGPLDINGLPPQVRLRWSFNRGKTWGQSVGQSTGEIGKYDTEPRFTPLGVGRFPLLEVSYSFAGPCALNGGWLDVSIGR